MVTIIIEKRHLFVFCIAVGLIMGGIFVYAYKANPDWTNSDPSKFGHSVDEMDWSQTINRDVSISRDVRIGGALYVGGQGVAFSDSSNVWLGDLYSADGPRNLIMRAGGADRIIITDGSGLVGIGKNPTEKLDVDGVIRAGGGFRFPDGTTQTTSAQAGRVLGGGEESRTNYGGGSCFNWGGATCSGSNLNCPAGTALRQTGYNTVTYQDGNSVTTSYYICVT